MVESRKKREEGPEREQKKRRRKKVINSCHRGKGKKAKEGREKHTRTTHAIEELD